MRTLNPNDLGKKFLVEECQKIKIDEFLKLFKKRFKELLVTTELETLGLKIELTTSKTYYNGIRYWFKCPQCSKRVGVLLVHPFSEKIGCRKCLGFEYRKRRYSGMIENSLSIN